MADQLATPSDLASLLQQDIDTSTATLLIETSTATVQRWAGQRIVQVVDDVVTLLGTADSWLDLPQIPVTAVSSVVRSGVTLTAGTDYQLIGNRLWCRWGWQSNLGWYYPAEWRPSYGPDPYLGPAPGVVVVTYTHGYAASAQELQLARSAVLTLAGTIYTNPGGVSSESIDDYTVQFASTHAATQAASGASSHLQAAIRKQYGRRGGLVRIG
jgi:hypothetical protein